MLTPRGCSNAIFYVHYRSSFWHFNDGDYLGGRRKAGAVMSEYVFKANNSSGVEYSIKIKAGDFFTARDRAQDYCYRCGLCFLGRA